MPFDPTTLDTYEKAQVYLPQPLSRRDLEQAVLQFAEGKDFWQNGDRYAGIRPALGDTVGWAMLKRSYPPILKNRECLKRHRRGVIGREPNFEWVGESITRTKKERRQLPQGENLTDDEQFAELVDKVQGEVWDEKGEHKIAKSNVLRLCGVGKSYLRYDIPPGLLVDGVDRNAPVVEGEAPKMVKGVASQDWTEVYGMTYQELCPPGTATVYVDSNTNRKISFYSYDEEIDQGKTRKCIQVSWVDVDSGLTQVRVLKDGAEGDSYPLDTGGFLLVEEAELEEPLVTSDMLQLQDIACSIAAMVAINAWVAGFPSTDAINMAEPTETKTVPDPDNPGQTKQIQVPVDLPGGPRVTRAFYSDYARDEMGKPLLDEDNKPIILNGALQYRTPVSSEPLRDDIEFLNTEIYSGWSQRHIQARTSADASGDMLIEMRSDYADSLLETKPDVERQMRNVFKGRLCMAAHLAGDAAALAKFKAGRVRVDLHLNAGPLSVAEKQFLVTEWDKGVLSTERLMVLLGDADDVQAEIKAIQEQLKATLGDRSPVAKGKLVAVK